MDDPLTVQQHNRSAAVPGRSARSKDRGAAWIGLVPNRERTARADTAADAPFYETFHALFQVHFPRVFRYLDRMTGEPELASDLAQETFMKLYQRGLMPDRPEAWLITVAMNLLRNTRSGRMRHLQLLTPARGEGVHSDAFPNPAQVIEARESQLHVRAAIETLPERERSLLMLHAEGYSYRDLATALRLNPASVGTLLARARAAFRQAYGDTDASP